MGTHEQEESPQDSAMNTMSSTHSFWRSYAHRVILSRSEGSHAWATRSFAAAQDDTVNGRGFRISVLGHS